MDRKNYYNSLIRLYEAAGMAGTEEVVPQENIADTGSDVGPAPTTQPAQQNIGNEEVVDEEQLNGNELPEEDTAYLNQEAPGTQPQGSSLVIEKQKFVKLFDLFTDLKTYGSAFLESIEGIDINLLDEKIFVLVGKYQKSVRELVEKIDSYLINIFNSERYEKALYNYILFRTELISVVKGLRRTLKLDQIDEEEEKK
jgi:hypothetical protein